MNTSYESCDLWSLMPRRGQGCVSPSPCLHPNVIAILLLLAAWFGSISGAYAGTTVQVIETWPSGDDVVLGRNQNFYLRLAYATDKPVGIWVNPYFRGKQVNVGSSPSLTYTGDGEALCWFFFMQPGEAVDEIRITAGDGSTANTPVVATWTGQVMGGNATATEQAQPAWVTDMLARAKAVQDEAYRAAMNRPIGAGGMALFSGFMLAILALGLSGFAAPAWGMWRWQGGWRLAAAVPAVMMGFVVLRIAAGVTIDPTSHNLWPFEILQTGVLSVVVMGVLWGVRKWFGTGR